MKRLRYENGPVDPVDARILEVLVADARTSIAEIARTVGLSPPSVSERIKRLEETGVIEGYAARINPRALGLGLSAWLRIRPVPGELRRVAETLQGLPAIVECDRVTGEDCFVARAHVESVEGVGGGDRPDHADRHDQHCGHPILARDPPIAADSGGVGQLAPMDATHARPVRSSRLNSQRFTGK